jgi:hypothetical protein
MAKIDDEVKATTEMVQVGVERSQAESIARSIAKVQGDTVTKDYLDLRLSEAVANLRQEMTKGNSDLMKEISTLKMDSQFTKWTNKAIMVSLGIITSALVKIAFFH